MVGTASTTSIKQFSCPTCSGRIEVHAVGQSLSAACTHCLTIVDVSSPELTVLQKFKENTKKLDPDIKLGTKGHLQGVDWRCIGIILQTDSTECWYWVEHLLFNPNKGFRWLVENQGHWTLFKKTKYKPKKEGQTVNIYSKNYKLYGADESKVVMALGEFYWRIKVGEKAKTKDYINPPEMLSMAKTSDDVVWSIGEYVTRDQVEAAFKLKNILPLPRGVAPHQPSPHAQSIASLAKYAMILVAALMLMQFFFSMSSKDQTVYQHVFRANERTPGTEQIASTPFTIKNGISNLEVRANANVNNNWINLGMTLINTDNNNAINFDHEVSYYSGYDSDGSWSEGSPSNAKMLSSIPEGNYILTVDPSNLEKIDPPEVSISLHRNVFFMGNFWIGLIALLIPPGISLVRRHMFEVKRWEESDYSPYSES